MEAALVDLGSVATHLRAGGRRSPSTVSSSSPNGAFGASSQYRPDRGSLCRQRIRHRSFNKDVELAGVQAVRVDD